MTAWFEGIILHKNIIARIGGIKLVAKAMKAWDPNAKEEVEEIKADDEDLDLFGDDNEEDAAAAKAIADKMKVDAKAKAPKKAVIAMSLVMLEVKPTDDEVNLDNLHARILKEINMEGLFWKTEYRKDPVAFGIFKLIVGFSLEDEKVSVDDIVEKIEAMDDMV